MTALERKTRKIRNALRDIYGGEESLDTIIAETLADLRHLCDADDASFAGCDRIAYQQYLQEKNTQMRFQFEDA
jgi:hypothetical protein